MKSSAKTFSVNSERRHLDPEGSEGGREIDHMEAFCADGVGEENA